MGIKGHPVEFSKAQIIQALKDSKGRVTYAADLLKIEYRTFMKLVNQDKSLLVFIDELRDSLYESRLDKAEDRIDYAMDQYATDLTNCLKASFYYLNNKGRPRGYSPPVKEAAPEVDTNAFQVEVQELAGASRSETSDRSKLENESPLLHKGRKRKQDSLSDESRTNDPLARSSPLQGRSKG